MFKGIITRGYAASTSHCDSAYFTKWPYIESEFCNDLFPSPKPVVLGGRVLVFETTSKWGLNVLSNEIFLSLYSVISF